MVGITIGNTCEALLGAYLLRRIGFLPSLQRTRDVIALAGLAGILSTTMSASVGVASLALGGAIEPSAMTSAWLLWWLGDLGGDLLVAPVIFMIGTGSYRHIRGRSALDAVAMLAVLAAAAFVVFSGIAPRAYLMFPILIVIALRSGQPGATVASFVTAAIAVAYTAIGRGPFAEDSLDGSLIQSQVFVAVGATTSMLLAALMTERETASASLEQARDALATANLAKDRFLSRVSHELRTPMNAVLGYAQVLQMDGPRDDQVDPVRQILRGGHHLLVLIDELLDVGRITSGALTLPARAVSVDEVIGEAVDLIRPLAADCQIEVRTDVADGVCVLADRQRLVQVLLNLLSNAVKYNRISGSIDVLVRGTPGSRLRIEVADRGTGIDPGMLDRLFLPFDRLGAETKGIRGTGLGLALTKSLIEAMGGTIGVGDAPSGGSVFWIELPAVPMPSAVRSAG